MDAGQLLSCAVLSALFLGASCSGDKATTEAKPDPTKGAETAPAAIDAGPTAVATLPPAPPLAATPLGLPELPASGHNPMSAEKVELGRLLFSELKLSGPGRTSCQSCHRPERLFADDLPRSKTAAGKPNLRHTPTLANVGYAKAWFWDGRMPTIEASLLVHWPGQLAADPSERIAALAQDPVYVAHFRRAFSKPPSVELAVQALASFVRSLRTGDSPWDKYESGDRVAVSADAILGFELFNGKAQCGLCHQPPLYTDNRFHNIGAGPLGPPDPGRARVTKRKSDERAFRTPGLRGLAMTAPYFHDGSAASLEEVLEHKLGGGLRTGNPAADAKFAELRLTAAEKQALLAFLAALSPKQAAP